MAPWRACEATSTWEPLGGEEKRQGPLMRGCLGLASTPRLVFCLEEQEVPLQGSAAAAVLATAWPGLVKSDGMGRGEPGQSQRRSHGSCRTRNRTDCAGSRRLMTWLADVSWSLTRRSIHFIVFSYTKSIPVTKATPNATACTLAPSSVSASGVQIITGVCSLVR